MPLSGQALQTKLPDPAEELLNDQSESQSMNQGTQCLKCKMASSLHLLEHEEIGHE